MTFEASIGDPPPRAMIVSGWNWRMSSAPALTSETFGSGRTVLMSCTCTRFSRRFSTSMILST